MFFKFSVPEDTRDWVLENFVWAIENGLLSRQTRLLEITAENFPAPKGDHPEVARALVDAISGHLGIDSAEMDVQALDVLPAEYQIDYNALSTVAGTWQGDENNRAVVHYDPNLTTTPVMFLAMLVHEVMHHRLHMTALDMPGGPEAEELATDLHCITTGFGLIALGGAESVGWQGYMRQETRAFSLAVFCTLLGYDAGATKALLLPRSAKMFGKAMKYMEKNANWLAPMRVALAETATN